MLAVTITIISMVCALIGVVRNNPFLMIASVIASSFMIGAMSTDAGWITLP